MKAFLFFLSLLLAVGPCSAERETPITRVVKLLQGLSKKAEMEGKIEEDLYEKFVCWAKTVIDTKMASNAAATSKIDELEAYIADIEAGRIEFTSERTDLEKELKELNEDIESATALRKQENSQFLEAEEEMTQAVTAMDKAIMVLEEATEGHESGTFLQRARATFSEGFAARSEDAEALARAVDLGQRSLSEGDAVFLRRLLTGDVPKADWKKLNRKATFKAKYKARSFKIQAVLKKLNETFTISLSEAREKEQQAQGQYDKLMESKGKQKDEAEEALSKMAQETGARAMNKEDAQEEVDSLKEQVASDDKFIKQTQDSLAEKKQEWKDRKKLRAAEVAAFSEAISILNSDDARDLRKRSFASQGYMFLQEGRTVLSSMQRITSAADVLREAARAGADVRLVALAARSATLSGGNFTAVVEAIDKMLKTLKAEATTDLENKEECEKTRATDTRAAIVASREMDDATDLMTKLLSEIEEIKAEIQVKEAAVKETQEQLDEATEQREEDNKEYQVNLADDEEMAKIVAKAKDVLAGFYKENNLMLVQGQHRQPEVAAELKAGKAPPPPPTTWEAPYGGKTQQSTGVITALEIIEKDVQKDIELSKSAEKEAQSKFDTFKKESLDMIQELNEAISRLTGTKGEKEESVSDLKEERGAKKKSLDAVLKSIADANPGCEYLTTTFWTKRKDRQIEMDGLIKAKAILSGAKFSSGPDPDRELKPGDALLQGHWH